MPIFKTKMHCLVEFPACVSKSGDELLRVVLHVTDKIHIYINLQKVHPLSAEITGAWR